MLRDASQPLSPASERETGGSYTRKEVCRLLKLENRQLKSWERQQLIPETHLYSFSDLLVLKKLVRLRSEHAHPRLMKQALHKVRDVLRKLPELERDVQVYKEGRRVLVQIGKQKMEPASGQLLFDFAEEEINKLLQLPPSQKSGATHC